MIVLDASAVVDWLLQTRVGLEIENRIYARGESLHVPHLLDLEVTQVLRRLVRERTIEAKRAEEATTDLLKLRIARYPTSFSYREFGNFGIIGRLTMPSTSPLPSASRQRC